MSNILIVDDIDFNIIALYDLTKALGHTPISAEGGLIALEKLKEHSIDLVLLDIMMPEIDGYEVLSHIKDDATLQHIPVIMITAVDEIDSAVNCIKMGADDYLTKPFNIVLLRARITACLQKKIWQDKEIDYRHQLEESNHKLEEQVLARTQELVTINHRLQILVKAKRNIIKLIYYGCKSSLHNLFKQHISSSVGEATELMEAVRQSFQLTKIDPRTVMYVFELKSITEILDLAVKSIMKFAKSRHVYIETIPSCGMQTLDQDILHNVINSWDDGWEDNLTLSENIITWKNIAEDGPNNEQQELYSNALAELLNIAIRFSQYNSSITISCEPFENEIKIGIHATGRTIADDEFAQFFEMPSDFKNITKGRHPGIGAAAAKNIIQLLGGSVTVKNRKMEGISFIVKVKRVEL